MIQRRTVFWGTSNGIPLNDPTGSSRFVVIPVETELPWRDVAVARESLLARAIQEYQNGSPSFSTADEMAEIQARNSNHQLQEPWYEALQEHAQFIVEEDLLPITNEGLNDAVGLADVSARNQRTAERITNVMTTLGYIQAQRHYKGERLRGWWPAQTAQPKN